MTIHNPLHPGILVKDALIDNTGLSVTEAAMLLDIARPTLSRFLNGRAHMSPEMALRLAKFFETSVESWLNLQSQYDVWLIQKKTMKIKVKPFRVALAA